MSEENPEAGRSIEERVLLWLPTPVVGLLYRDLRRLPPGSHLRRRLLKRALARGFEAVERDDYAFPSSATSRTLRLSTPVAPPALSVCPNATKVTGGSSTSGATGRRTWMTFASSPSGSSTLGIVCCSSALSPGVDEPAAS